MSLRGSLYILLVITVAGISALTGALAGGVAIYRTLQENLAGQLTIFGPTGDQTGSGTGFFITNNYVVQGPQEVTIILSDVTEQQASIVGTDLYSDIAVLRTDGDVPAVAKLGNSDVLKPRESVIAIGSPLGNFKNTVTVGVISATGRSIDTGNGDQIEDLIQTDVAIYDYPPSGVFTSRE